MGLFDRFSAKDSREKHSAIDVIEYSGPNNVLVWKHECENFNTGSQLIVAESQVAVFFKDGVALQSFPAGRYTLTTQNYPFIRALVRSVTGGKSPFQCSVYYVNKAVSMGVSWGTDSPIRMNDPVYNLPTNITSYGDFSVYVEEEKRMLCQLVGTMPSYTQEDISTHFANLIATKVRSLITGALIENKLSLLGIDAHLDSISDMLLPRVQAVFESYGIGVKHFVVSHIGYTGLEEIEQELHKQTRENIRFSGQLQRDTSQRDFNIDTQIKEGHATAVVNRELGISELQKKMMGVAEAQAHNLGPIMGGSDLNIGLPGATIGGLSGAALQTPGAAATESLKVIAGLSVPSAAAQPAAEAPRQEDSFEAQVKRLKMMRDNDLLTEEEFAQQKQRLLMQIMNGGTPNA